jgi:hypothetical protein
LGDDAEQRDEVGDVAVAGVAVEPAELRVAQVDQPDVASQPDLGLCPLSRHRYRDPRGRWGGVMERRLEQCGERGRGHVHVGDALERHEPVLPVPGTSWVGSGWAVL